MTSTAASRDPAVPRRALLLLACAPFAASLNLRVCDPLLPEIARDFSTTVGATSAIVALFTLAYGLTQLLFGPLGDRFGKWRVIALTTVVAGLATLASAAMPTLPALAVARFAAGAFAAAAVPLAFAWIGDAVPFERRQPVLARFLSAQISAIVLAQALGGALGDAFGWRAVFLVVGAVHLAAGLAMLIELRLDPAAQPPASPPLPGGIVGAIGGMLAIARRPWSRVLIATVAVEAFALYGAFAYVGADLAHRFALRPAAAGLVLAAFGAGALAYALTAAHLIARLGQTGLATAGGATMAASFLVLAATPSVWAVPPALAALGLGFYMLHNTLQTHATQMAPEARGLGVSMFALALFFGQAGGVAVNAPVIDRYGAPPVFVAAAIVLAGLGLWFRRRLDRRGATP